MNIKQFVWDRFPCKFPEFTAFFQLGMFKGDKKKFRVPFLAPLIVFGSMVLLWPTTWNQRMENLTVDWRFRARAKSDPEPDSRILLVGIGEYSLKRLGRWEDWTRDIHGEFSRAITNRPPTVLAWDFFFSENSRDTAHDTAFADNLALHLGAITGAIADTTSEGGKAYQKESIGNTFPIKKVEGDISKMLTADNGYFPIDVIAESSWTGFVNVPPLKIDGMRREIPLVVNLAGKVYPSLVLQIVMRLEKVRTDDIAVKLGESIRIPKAEGKGEWIVPIDVRGFMRINYRDTDRFQKMDYVKLIESLNEFEKTGAWPADFPQVENQIVLLGQMAEGLSDFGPTPYHAEEPAVTIQANALNNILRGDYLKTPSRWMVLFVWLLIGWLTLWRLQGAAVWLTLAVPLLLIAGYVFTALQIFSWASIQLPVFLPVTGFILLHGTAITERLAAEMRAKREIRSIFGAYAGKELVSQIIESGEKPHLGGEKAEITVFFSDVASFSAFSEQLSPEDLVALMINYMSEMTDVLMENGGVLDKYVGDSIVGMFGVLVPLKDHAYRAVSTAIRIQKRQYQLREEWRKTGGWPDAVYAMQTRIGLNTGDAIIGNMGSRQRFNFTMMGDTVNLAARCESGAKAYGAVTMITEDTRNAALKTKDDIIYRYLDKIVVVGRTEPVAVYEVMGFTAEIAGNVMECLGIYDQAIEKYLARDWSGAAELFEKSALIEPWQPGVHAGIKTNPSRVMQERCAAMEKSPPPEDWDGVFMMTGK